MHGWGYGLLIAFIIVAATLAAHGWSLTDGLLLDDHWHRLQLQNNDWSLKGLLEATTIQPDRFIDTWWQEKPIRWQYIRPFSVLVAKTVYHLSAGSVKAWHAISIAGHLVNAFLVYHLCLWLTRRRFWSVVGALLFVVYSHSVYAVAWLAAQNIILQTTLMLTALLCYTKASGLNVYAAPLADDDCTQPDDESIRPLKKGLFVCALACWCLALLSRENAIVLPVILAAFDLAFGGWRHLRARAGVYVLLASIGLAFMLWRLVFFYSPMPDFYVRRPDGAGYLLWVLAKLMHYYTATIWLSPMTIGPSGRYNPFVEVPWDCVLMVTILAVLGTYYFLACRQVRGYWIWPMWILLAVLPVVPVLATPHSGYLPSVGFAVGMVLGPALRHRVRPNLFSRWSCGVAIWFLIATTVYMPIYRPMWYSFLAAERATIQRVVFDPPPKTATQLFFINLPFVNIYAQLHLRHAWGLDANTLATSDQWGQYVDPVSDYLGPTPASFRSGMLEAGPQADFRCHVLTYAPDVLRMDQPCKLEQLDAHSFSVEIEGRPYFGGALGRFLIEGMRDGRPFQTGDCIAGELFNVTIDRADSRGAWRLTFRFKEPLASERYCFYTGTQDCSAKRLRFAAPEGVVKAEAPGAELSGAAAERFAPILKDEAHFAHLRWLRDRLFQIRAIAARIIRTDLYLTGPEYPGPR